MADFPTPFAGAAALYPLTQEKRFPVTVLQFSDFTEQRYVRSAGLSRFRLQLTGISKAAKDDIVDFFETCKGTFDATWSIEIAGVIYDYMAFADDTLAAVESEQGWSLNVDLVQTRKN